jgi:RNA polymerase sigma-70 factor (ECF subfamily)
MQQTDIKRLVDSFSDSLYRFAIARVQNADIAKDLVQDTFIAAWKNYSALKNEASEKNRLFKILKNKIIDHFRKASTRYEIQPSELQISNDFFEEDGHWKANVAPQNWGNSTSALLETKEFNTVFGNCIDKLKVMQQAVFSLKFLEGMDSDEICKVLRLTPSNYWVLMHRAKVQLRNCLEKNWFLK